MFSAIKLTLSCVNASEETETRGNAPFLYNMESPSFVPLQWQEKRLPVRKRHLLCFFSPKHVCWVKKSAVHLKYFFLRCAYKCVSVFFVSINAFANLQWVGKYVKPLYGLVKICSFIDYFGSSISSWNDSTVTLLQNSANNYLKTQILGYCAFSYFYKYVVSIEENNAIFGKVCRYEIVLWRRRLV